MWWTVPEALTHTLRSLPTHPFSLLKMFVQGVLYCPGASIYTLGIKGTWLYGHKAPVGVTKSERRTKPAARPVNYLSTLVYL